ncbi:GntR family transcriptional regulator [Palleronia aestuarii]|uniref:GntR family transcriptional regulator n=1 Tax=Palleronia aestuarii TaxID=568105 RepID=A0A2W7MXT2_9RHOB|nr:GntR family transcriptional regulator [Palleronia aestuarii]PZX12353.1 GntR family transcriptional regulator [Palleronia aestuarii]
MTTRTKKSGPSIRANDRIYEEVRNGILTKRLPPGQKITEELLAEQFGVSRTPVRSAIVRLASDGFVEITPHSGTVVKRRLPGEIAEIYDVRALLESAAAGLCADVREAKDLSDLEQLHGTMEEIFNAAMTGGTAQIEELSLLNKRFHERILKSCRNATLMESASRLMEIGFLINTYVTFSREEIGRSMDDHRKLITAIQSRDVHWAECVMRSHILGARNSLMKDRVGSLGSDAAGTC